MEERVRAQRQGAEWKGNVHVGSKSPCVPNKTSTSSSSRRD